MIRIPPLHWRGVFVRLFLSSFVTSLVIFLLAMGICVHVAVSAVEEEKALDMTIITERTDRYLDQTIVNLKNLLLLLAAEDTLAEAADPARIRRTIDAYLENSTSIARNMYVQLPDGPTVSNRQPLFDAVGNEGLLRFLSDLRQERLQTYTMRVSEPYYARLCSGTTVAFAMPLRSRTGQTVIVAAEIDVPALTTRLTTIMASIPGSFVLLSGNGDLVTSRTTLEPLLDPTGYSPPVRNDVLDSLRAQDDGSRYMTLGGVPLLYTARSDNQLGWKLVILVEKRSYLRRAEDISKLFALLILASVPLFASAIFLVSRSFTRPVLALSRIMNDLDAGLAIPELGDLTTRGDEVGRLARSFRESLLRIKTLHEHQREILEQRRILEIRTLQDQIHPHFLSNTLACIGSLTKREDRRPAQEAIRLLLTLLQYGLDRARETVTLREELGFIASYCELQRIRKGDRFRLEVDVEEDHGNAVLPRLILQPVVENALFHGLALQSQDGLLRIRTVLNLPVIHVFVEDNGVGIGSERLAAILDEPSSPGTSMTDESEPYRRIGLRNVDKRIKLFFGDGYGLFVRSQPGTGTSVELCIPFRTGGTI
jgi:two-component system, sensor histidine kinase YesM